MTARTILRISNGLTLFCMAGTYTRKSQHIVNNPNVAIAYANIQIEGQARPTGHPLNSENTKFMEAYSRQHPELVERSKQIHFQRSKMGVIEISPSRVTLYNRANIDTGEDAYLELLDVENKEAYKIPRTLNGYESPKYT